MLSGYVTGGYLGMLVAAVGVIAMLIMSASITKEKFDKAIEQQTKDGQK